MFDSEETSAINANGLGSESKTNGFGQPDHVAEQVHSFGMPDQGSIQHSRRSSRALTVSASRLLLSTNPVDDAKQAVERRQDSAPVSCCAANTAGLSEEEVRLANDIVVLWNGDRMVNAQSRKERADRRLKLSEKLAQFKAVLAKPGREGGWSEFLRKNKLSRTTADRYVQKWEDSINPERMNCSTGAIRRPTDEEIQGKVARMTRRLKREFPDPVSIKHFLDALVAALQISNK